MTQNEKKSHKFEIFIPSVVEIQAVCSWMQNIESRKFETFSFCQLQDPFLRLTRTSDKRLKIVGIKMRHQIFKLWSLTRVTFMCFENIGSIIMKSFLPATKQWILWSASKWMTDRVPPELIHRFSSCKKSLNDPHIIQASIWRSKVESRCANKKLKHVTVAQTNNNLLKLKNWACPECREFSGKMKVLCLNGSR